MGTGVGSSEAGMNQAGREVPSSRLDSVRAMIWAVAYGVPGPRTARSRSMPAPCACRNATAVPSGDQVGAKDPPSLVRRATSAPVEALRRTTSRPLPSVFSAAIHCRRATRTAGITRRAAEAHLLGGDDVDGDPQIADRPRPLVVGEGHHLAVGTPGRIVVTEGIELGEGRHRGRAARCRQEPKVRAQEQVEGAGVVGDQGDRLAVGADIRLDVPVEEVGRAGEGQEAALDDLGAAAVGRHPRDHRVVQVIPAAPLLRWGRQIDHAGLDVVDGRAPGPQVGCNSVPRTSGAGRSGW